MPADEQLERLLYILPVAARGEGVHVGELARALGTTAGTVLADLEAATNRIYYHPAGAVESFTIMIEGDVVRVRAPDQFHRPVRLNEREALALGLGLRALAADEEEPRRSEVLALAARLEAELSAPGDLAAHGYAFEERALHEPRILASEAPAPITDVEYDPDLSLAFGDDGLRGIIADAIELGRVCTLHYLKPGSGAPEHRRIAPYRLVHAEGNWYVASHDLDRDDLRFFRLDRVLDVRVQPETAPEIPPVDLHAMLSDGAAYIARDEASVTVRYSASVARWIVEQRGGGVEPDGSVVVRHSVADPRWLVRHVLQYGGAATVTDPAEAREWVREAAVRMVTSRP